MLSEGQDIAAVQPASKEEEPTDSLPGLGIAITIVPKPL